MDKHTEAEPFYRRALAGFQEALGAEHPHTQLARGALDRCKTDKEKAALNHRVKVDV